MSEQQMSEQDKVFFQDGLRLASATLEDGTNRQSLLQITRQAQVAIDGLVDAISAEATRQKITIDCKKGCSWCCHQPIFATSHEMHFIWEFLKLNFKGEERQVMLQQAFNNYQKRGRMDEKVLLSSKLPCPFLKSGSCSIYPARPIACRIYLSMSAPSCQTFYNQPDSKDNYPRLFEFPLQTGRMLNEGINKGLHDADLHNREMLIEEGLLVAHNNGEPSIENLKDQPLFMKVD